MERNTKPGCGRSALSGEYMHVKAQICACLQVRDAALQHLCILNGGGGWAD